MDIVQIEKIFHIAIYLFHVETNIDNEIHLSKVTLFMIVAQYMKCEKN